MMCWAVDAFAMVESRDECDGKAPKRARRGSGDTLIPESTRPYKLGHTERPSGRRALSGFSDDGALPPAPGFFSAMTRERDLWRALSRREGR